MNRRLGLRKMMFLRCCPAAGRHAEANEQKGRSSGGSRVTIKNQNGVVVNVVSPIKECKFDLTREGLEYSSKNNSSPGQESDSS
jgi:hypothetical protein